MFALHAAFSYNWHEEYKKQAGNTHRATTQYLVHTPSLFVAKALVTGSDFTEMKTRGLNKEISGRKRKECETGRLIL
ncbi:hypothetical protein CO701_03455 [Citrobacter werkmanii]|nr:hypothetical protein CO701_03455 [Citrobacter werkmanii]